MTGALGNGVAFPAFGSHGYKRISAFDILLSLITDVAVDFVLYVVIQTDLILSEHGLHPFGRSLGKERLPCCEAELFRPAESSADNFISYLFSLPR
jgi:hypothetical protein